MKVIAREARCRPALCSETRRRGRASYPGGQQSATVTGSARSLCPQERSRRRGPALEQAELCERVRVCTYGCGGSNLECAGGDGLSDMIDSPFSLQRVEPSATYFAVCLLKSGGGDAPPGLAVVVYALTLNS